MTKETTSFVYVTYILSTPEKVFEAITKPDVARRYWGHENVSDWNPGSKWEHIRANDERTVELVGKVIEVSPPTRLVITWANASQASDPASYSRVTFEIEEYDNMVRLTVTHDELEAGSGMANGRLLGASARKALLPRRAAERARARARARHARPRATRSCCCRACRSSASAPSHRRPSGARWSPTGTQYFQNWWMSTFPGLAIFTAVLAFNFLGDSLRDVVRPAQRARRGRGAAVTRAARGRGPARAAADARAAG